MGLGRVDGNHSTATREKSNGGIWNNSQEG
jgi:hypothetical protein